MEPLSPPNTPIDSNSNESTPSIAFPTRSQESAPKDSPQPAELDRNQPAENDDSTPEGPRSEMQSGVASNLNPDKRKIDLAAAETANVEQHPEESDGHNPGDTFLSSVVLLLGLTVAQKLIGFVRTVIVCRMLPPEEMGLWSMVQVTMATVLPIFLLSIPACFGRYFEFYRGRKQLRAFIKQATILCVGLLLTGVATLIVFRVPIARFTLGGPELSGIVIYLALALIPFAVFSFMTELLTALRFSRFTTIGHFLNGTSLAVLSIALLYFNDATAVSMILAFAAAYLLSLLWMLSKMGTVVRSLPKDDQNLPFRFTWYSMTPVILLFWFNDFMTNMFSMSDRYMLVNLIPGDTSTVLHEIGNYESGHVIPILFAAVTSLIAKTLMPYLANAWEDGQRDVVSQQTHLSIKMVTAVSIAGGLLFLPLSDFVFDSIFQGKYTGGSSVLPYLVFFYVGSGFTALIMNYYWCAHRAPWAVLALVFGVLINVSCNFAMVPHLGIVGAAIGTALGITCQVISLLVMANRFGLSFDRGTICIGTAAALLLLDPAYWPVWIGILLTVVFLPGNLSKADWETLRQTIGSLTDRLHRKPV